MKFIGLLILILLLPYEVEHYQVINRTDNIIVLNKSIDYITKYCNNYDDDFYLHLELYDFSDQNNFFEYRLSQKFYIEQLTQLLNRSFFRSNGVLISVDQNDSLYLNRSIFNIKDSIESFNKEFYSKDSLALHSFNWSFFQVKYQNDTLVGTINFDKPISFDLMKIE